MADSPHDKFFKDGFANPAHAVEHFKGVLPAALIEALDLDKARLLSGTSVDEGFKALYSDRLYAIPLRPRRSGSGPRTDGARSVADLATDPQDLLLYVLDLAPDASSSDVARAQDLFLRRLQVDWQAVVAAGGNPYKEDYKRSGRRTAMGDLANSFDEQRHRVRNPRVFNSLAPRIEALAKELPGTHPFLRKWFKRLAKKLRE